MFKVGYDKFTLIPMFDPANEELRAERHSRFVESMDKVVAGTFFNRPTGAEGYRPPHATAHYNHKPIFDR